MAPSAPTPLAAPPPAPTTPRATAGVSRIAAVAWIAGLILTLTPIIAPLADRGAPLDIVLQAMSGRRLVDGRVTAAAYASPEAPVRSAAAARPEVPWPVLAAAGQVEELANRWPTAPHLQAFGVAALAAGHEHVAVQALEDAALVDPSNAAIQSDLAAAYLARAQTTGAGIDVPRAIEAADRALRFDPHSHEARFNYALALERLNVRHEAARAWRAVIADGVAEGVAAEGWTAEARAHLARMDTAVAVAAPSAAVSAAASLAQWARGHASGSAVPVPDLAAAGRFYAAITTALREATPARRRALAATIARLADADAALTAGDLVTSDRLLNALPPDALTVDSPFGLWARRIRLTANFGVSAGRDLRGEAEALLEGARRHGFADLEGDALHRIGGFEFTSGAYERALEYFEAAVRVRTNRNNARGTASSRLLSADAYAFLGRAPEAWAAYLQLLTAAPTGDRLLEASRLSNPAHQASNTGFYATAVALTREALQDDAADAVPGVASTSAYLAGRAWALYGHAGEAADVLTRATALARTVGGALEDRILAEIALVEAEMYVASDPARAIRAAITAQRGLLDSKTFHRMLELKVHEARAHRALHDVPSARAALMAGVAIVDDQQRRIARQDFLPSFVDASWDVFSELVDLEAEAGRAEEALRWLDRGFDIRRRWRSAGSTVNLADLSRRGPLVVYLARPEALRIWVVVDGVAHQREVPVPRATLERHTARLAHVLTLDGAPEALEAAIAVIARDVWWPVAPLLASGSAPSRVALVLDPLLQPVPFALLPWSAAAPEVVLDRTATVLCPSISACAASVDGVTASAPRVAALHAGQGGDGLVPLPMAHAEADRIGRRYAGATVGVATEAAFVRALADVDLLHFSGHAVADERYPGRSALLLATPDGDGARVSLDRLLAGQVRARLVVLSACRTSRAEALRGEGGAGIAGELLRTGVRDVVAAQWDVRDDVAGELMDHVHEALAAGASPWDALRAAQQQLRRAGPRPARDWAGYVAYTSAPR